MEKINYILTDADKRQLDSLIKIETSLYKLRDQYFKMIHSDNIRKDKYKLNVDCQEMAIQSADNIYQNIFKSIYKLRASMNYLIGNYSEPSTCFLVDVLSSGNQNIITKRMILTLFYNNIFSEKEYYEEYNLESPFYDEEDDCDTLLIDSNDGYESDFCKKEYRKYLDDIEISAWLEAASIRLFLINLEDVINNNDYLNIKDKLITAKSNTYFLNKYLDEDVFNKNIVKIIPNLNNPTLLFNCHMSKYNNLKNEYGFNMCISFVREAFKLAYLKEMNDDNVTDFVLIKTYLKTYSALIDKYYLNVLQNEAKKCISRYDNNDISNDECTKRAKSIQSIFNNKSTQYVKK